ncbi:MAG: hypothetical protein SOR93_17330 [Clostridiales Family XIII bacterium]|uniref:hypothetical protein n=1 Tax=Streptococcus hyovaginalis TaxID=149015 RepID=UPI002A7999A9|nr:hypothetical protein [Streptococcus hyovaginalis]MDY3013003.1 hypothetical protein [Clostridiales Family XIII bacterium]MDY4511381.1 hypothetical protein [Streptococcus hyovaginalis]
MSEFYKRKRNLIIKNYKYLGMKEKVSFYLYRFSMILTAIVLYAYLSEWLQSENNKVGGLGILFFIIIVCYFVSKSDSKKQQKDKMEAVSHFVKQPDINIETVETLIGEIERYNKKMRTFAAWIAGLSATFLILLATLATNFCMKIFDVYLKVVPTDKLSNMLENITHNSDINDTILSYLELGFMLLFTFMIVILIIYNVFTMFTFIKEQILIFLFDVKYEILSGSSQENESKSDEETAQARCNHTYAASTH